MKTTLLRISKECRALLPLWTVALLAIAAPHFLGTDTRSIRAWAMFAYCAGCIILGAACFGHEFAHRTLSILLSQPVSRTRLWLEKMIVLGVMLSGLSLLFSVILTRHDFLLEEPRILVNTLMILMPASIAFCTGPTLTLLTRGVIAGAALTFIFPMASAIIALSVAAVRHGTDMADRWMPDYTFIFQSIYSLALLPLGWWILRRFQDSNTVQQDFLLPSRIGAPFQSLPALLTFNGRGPIARLVQKELRLQQPTFFVGALIIVVWLGLSIISQFRPVSTEAITLTPFILGMIGVPAVAGIICVADERNLGLHNWQLTLPISARRQWAIKVMTTIMASMFSGILIPLILLWLSKLLLGPIEKGLLSDFRYFPWLNLVFASVAMYASTFSTNNLRALVGTVLLSILGVSVIVLLEATFLHYGKYHGTFVISGPLFYLTFEMGLSNFRKTTLSNWAPVRQVLLFFGAMLALLLLTAE